MIRSNRRRRLPLCFVKLLFPFLAILLFSSADAPVKIVFFGDSLTQAGIVNHGFIRQIQSRLDHEGLGDRFELDGRGIGGNMVRHLLERVESDVIAEKPGKLVLMVGINDVGFHTWHPETGGTPADQYEIALEYLVRRCASKGIQTILCTPTVIGEKPFGGNPEDKMLDQYAEICRRVARKNKVLLCDLRKTFTGYLNNNNSRGEKLLTTDNVHLNAKGDSLIAAALYPLIVRR